MTVDEINWKVIIEEIKPLNPRFHAVLRSVLLKDHDIHSVTLEAPSPFHMRVLQDSMPLLEKVIEHVTGQCPIIHLTQQPTVFPRPLPPSSIPPPKLSDREIDEIASTYLTELEQDIDKQYTYQDFEVFDTALTIYIEDINKIFKTNHFYEVKRSSIFVEYGINFVRVGGLYEVQKILGAIKIRKIGNEKIELVIENPFWHEENRKFFFCLCYGSRRFDTTDISQNVIIDEAIERTNSIITTSQQVFQDILARFEADELLSSTLIHKTPRQRNNTAYGDPETHIPAESEIPLARYQFHPCVIERATPFWRIGEYDTALSQVCIALDNAVKEKSGLTEDGTTLMRTAFSPKKTRLAIDPRFGNQQGFMELFAGVMDAIRNPRAHHHKSNLSADEAIEWLAFLSALFRVLDATTINNPNEAGQGAAQ